MNTKDKNKGIGNMFKNLNKQEKFEIKFALIVFAIAVLLVDYSETRVIAQSLNEIRNLPVINATIEKLK